MGACLGSCVGGFAASALCSVGVKSKTSKTPFIIFLVVNVIIALVLNRYGEAITIPGIDQTICNENCKGNAAVFRVSFALAVFFLLHGVFCMCFLDCHNLCWPGKLLAYIAGLVACFFIDNPLFDTYARIAQVVSIFFLLAQIILLIDFAYRWNEAWVSEDGDQYEGMTPKQKGLIAISLIFNIICIVTWGILYKYWDADPASSCSRNKTLISVTVIISILHTFIAVTEWCDHGALLPSSVVTLYTTYVLYSALSSDPSECNAADPANRSEAELWIGLVIAACSIGYAGYNVSTNSGRLFGTDEEAEEKPNPSSPMLSSEPTRKKSVDDTGDVEDPESGKKSKSNIQKEADVELAEEEEEQEISDDKAAEFRKANSIFHFVMFAAACYMAMLLSNWGVYSDAVGDISDTDISTTSLWVKVASQWATMILYLWTLVAPNLCGNREFGY